MKITREELNLFRDQARRSWIELQSGVCLPGTFKPLGESDRIAVGWLQAAIDILNVAGFIDLKKATPPGDFLDLDLEFDLPDSSTPTDGFDAGISDEDDKTPL